MTDMSKRIQVTLPDRLAEELDQWANADGRAVANLCAFLLERAVRQAKQSGDYPSVEGSR
ncbi:ribbon-helix-helix domain-containing protein [Nodosilinea sp. LEGE 07298]|uniref:ribbon-helix-helix domain-containing protein n=1 Tax=Nodosilinea sp. LEGE 07298 TaxID=2777970 RepID=UPI0037C9894D